MNKAYLFFLITVICSCSKDKFLPAEKNLTFSGLVWDYSNGHRIGNANVKLELTKKLAFDRIPTSYDTISDNQGNFSFSLRISDENEYKIIPSKAGYVFVDTGISWFQPIESTSILFDTVLIDAASILQVNFHDINASSINDTLNLSVGFGSDSLNIEPSSYHNTFISYNTSLEFFDSTSFKQNCFARIKCVLNNNLFQVQTDTTVRLIEFGTKTVDVYY